MGWAVGYDTKWKRDIGYDVPATCDQPGCDAKIDRGLAYVCGGEPYGGERGCGLYFCAIHLSTRDLCRQCKHGGEPFAPTSDVPEWINHKLTDPSWQQWRDEHPDEVAVLAAGRARLRRWCETAPQLMREGNRQ